MCKARISSVESYTIWLYAYLKHLGDLVKFM